MICHAQLASSFSYSVPESVRDHFPCHPIIRVVQIALLTIWTETWKWSADPWPWTGTARRMGGNSRWIRHSRATLHDIQTTCKYTTTCPSTPISGLERKHAHPESFTSFFALTQLLLSWTSLPKMISHSAHGMFAHGRLLPGSLQRRRKEEKLQRLWAKAINMRKCSVK